MLYKKVIPLHYQAGFFSVVHLSTGGNDNSYGDRIPAILFYDYGRLYTCSALNGNKNKCISSPDRLLLNQWFFIRVSQESINQTSYNYTVNFNGINTYTVINNDARVFSDVQVFTSSPWYSAQPCSIRKLTITGGNVSLGMKIIS